jgi:hypothetical protein
MMIARPGGYSDVNTGELITAVEAFTQAGRIVSQALLERQARAPGYDPHAAITQNSMMWTGGALLAGGLANRLLGTTGAGGLLRVGGGLLARSIPLATVYGAVQAGLAGFEAAGLERQARELGIESPGFTRTWGSLIAGRLPEQGTVQIGGHSLPDITNPAGALRNLMTGTWFDPAQIDGMNADARRQAITERAREHFALGYDLTDGALPGSRQQFLATLQTLREQDPSISEYADPVFLNRLYRDITRGEGLEQSRMTRVERDALGLLSEYAGEERPLFMMGQRFEPSLEGDMPGMRDRLITFMQAQGLTWERMLVELGQARQHLDEIRMNTRETAANTNIYQVLKTSELPGLYSTFDPNADPRDAYYSGTMRPQDTAPHHGEGSTGMHAPSAAASRLLEHGDTGTHLQALRRAFVEKESSGNYHASNYAGNAAKYGGAHGAYQILASNFVGPGGWDMDALGQDITLEQFYANEDMVQDKIALHRMDQYWNDPRLEGLPVGERVRRLGASWYGGPRHLGIPSSDFSRTPQAAGHPSIYDYSHDFEQRFLRHLDPGGVEGALEPTSSLPGGMGQTVNQFGNINVQVSMQPGESLDEVITRAQEDFGEMLRQQLTGVLVRDGTVNDMLEANQGRMKRSGGPSVG